MKAMLIKALGKDLELTDIMKPDLYENAILVRVVATSLNFADTLLIEGKYQEMPKLPFAPGMEICGIVEEVGLKVTNFEKGDKVLSLVGYGGLAEFIAPLASQCIKIPKNLPSIEVATLMIAYGTSELALNYKAKLKPKENLLVLGAAGGVGLTAVEIGKIMGARIIAVANGTEKCDFLRRIGAHEVIDSNQPDLINTIKKLGGADVIYDPIGGRMFDIALKVANKEARLVPIGFASGEIPQIPANILLVKNVTVIGFYISAYRHFKQKILLDCLTRLIDMHSQNLIKPYVSNIFSLDQTNEAINLIKNRMSTGKVVIKLSDD